MIECSIFCLHGQVRSIHIMTYICGCLDGRGRKAILWRMDQPAAGTFPMAGRGDRSGHGQAGATDHHPRHPRLGDLRGTTAWRPWPLAGGSAADRPCLCRQGGARHPDHCRADRAVGSRPNLAPDLRLGTPLRPSQRVDLLACLCRVRHGKPPGAGS
jgi:hypothetical protein